MQRLAYYFHARTLHWHKSWVELAFGCILLLMVVIEPIATASTRFEDRSLFMQSTLPGVTNNYTVSMRYMTPGLVGSVELLFCNNPIPYMPCEVPQGLDVSQAQLTEQLGEQGFSILSRTQNKLVISRPPTLTSPTDPTSSYKFENIVNPIDSSQAFSIRMKSFSGMSAAGPQIDFGSVRGQVTNAIVIQTQVPPMLMFCVAQTVSENCQETDEVNYRDMGSLSPSQTLTAQSQMSAGTNATAGFVITAFGTPMASGNSIIDNIDSPAPSQVGVNQFGINLVENSQPDVGSDPEGAFTNAVIADDYNTPNLFKFSSGDVVAYSPNVSLMRKYTVSYVVNSSPDLRAGIYTATINFIASGRFQWYNTANTY